MTLQKKIQMEKSRM